MTKNTDLIQKFGETKDPYAIAIRESAKIEGFEFFTPETTIISYSTVFIPSLNFD